jgi:hypothetical protein
MQVIRLVLALLFWAGAFHPFRTTAAQTLAITNGVRTFAGLTNTTVLMSNRCELRVTGATNPIPGCVIHLNGRDTFLVLQNIEPSSVVLSHLSQLRVNGAPAVADSNCRVVQYGARGAIVIPHAPSFQPLQVFTGPYFTDQSAFLGQYIYYRNTDLGAFNATISSFKLKRGYMATFAQNPNGSGISSCYVAQDGDLDVSVLRNSLNDRIRFIYVMPWRWVAKKGSCDVSPATLRASWWYNWNINQNSTPDMEYVAIKQQPYWPGLDQNWQTRGVNHLSGYNEPNNPVEDAYENLSPPGSVDDAVARWPELLGAGLRLGAPAVTDGGYSWIVDFIEKSDAQAVRHRIDYVPVHYYRSYSNNGNPQGAANNLYNFLKGIYDAVKRPLWVTEFNNGANWTSDPDPTFEQNRDAIEAMINMMDNTPWIERYSIYSAVEEVRQTHYNAGGLTPMGTMYRDHVAPMAYLQGLEHNGTRDFAQLRFDGEALDTSGHGNNGVASGSPAYTNGRNGQAVVFDGANTVVTLPPNIALGNSFTFAAWINWSGGGNWQRIFDFGNSTTHYMFLTPSSGSGTLRFASRNGGSERMVETSALPVNQWCHVAVTLSGGTARLYVNGVEAVSNTGIFSPSQFSPRVNFLGKSQFIADPLFRGLMDNVLISDIALSAAQIAALQTNTAPQVTNTFISLINATQAQTYTGSINGAATDPDGGTITYSKASGPLWLSISSSGSLNGVPGGSHVGTNHFTVCATDSAGESAFAVLTVVVHSSLTGGPALLARYPFDGNPLDASRNSNDGTPFGSPLFPGGGFVDLSGTNQYVLLPAGLFASVTNFTIAVWVKWDGGRAFQRIFDFGNDTTEYMFLTPSSSSGTMRFSITTSGAGGEQSLRTAAPPIGQWQHIAITRNGNTTRLYTNAVLATNGTITIAPASFNPVVNYVGKSQYATDPLFNGGLDALFIYNHALGDAEIMRLAANQPPPFFPGRISISHLGDSMQLSWPATHLGSRLESRADGLTPIGRWLTVFGSASTNQMSIPINRSGPSVFFRLVYP